MLYKALGIVTARETAHYLSDIYLYLRGVACVTRMESSNKMETDQKCYMY